jgi:hypothetical protein
VFAAEVVSLRLISHPKEKIITDAQERVSGAISGGCASKVSDYKEGVAAEASCFIISMN